MVHAVSCGKDHKQAEQSGNELAHDDAMFPCGHRAKKTPVSKTAQEKLEGSSEDKNAA